MCACVRGVYLSVSAQGSQRGCQSPPGAEFQAPEAELRTSARAVSAFNCGVISPSPKAFFSVIKGMYACLCVCTATWAQVP